MVQKIHMLAVIAPALILPVIALTVLTPVAYANNGAVVINDLSCGLFDGDGNIASLDSSHLVTTHSGNSIFTCSGIVPNSSGHAVKYDADNNPFGPGLTCSTPTSDTLNWHEIVSADGHATVFCQTK